MSDRLLSIVRKEFPQASLINTGQHSLSCDVLKLTEAIRKARRYDQFDVIVLTRNKNRSKDRSTCRMRSYSPNDAYLCLDAATHTDWHKNSTETKVCYLPFVAMRRARKRPERRVSPFQYYLLAIVAGLCVVLFAHTIQWFGLRTVRTEQNTNDRPAMVKDEKV